uniref:Ig-like domain-containing protein n=1 Tax=Terrapene triunguis TaxID=2587831 RepID=A0A674ID44_9SAUR
PQTRLPQEEPSMSVTPGETVTLSCSLSTGAITTSNYPAWFQQKPGSAPRQLIYNTNNRPSGIPARFSGSISGNNAALTITGVQAEDEADYYCLVWASSVNHSDPARWGTETKTSPVFTPSSWALHWLHSLLPPFSTSDTDCSFLRISAVCCQQGALLHPLPILSLWGRCQPLLCSLLGLSARNNYSCLIDPCVTPTTWVKPGSDGQFG